MYQKKKQLIIVRTTSKKTKTNLKKQKQFIYQWCKQKSEKQKENQKKIDEKIIKKKKISFIEKKKEFKLKSLFCLIIQNSIFFIQFKIKEQTTLFKIK